MAVYEAENMTISPTASIESEDGLTFVNPGGPHGSGANEVIKWRVAETGSATITFTYNNPSQGDRPVTLMLNQRVLSTFSCPPMGRWTKVTPVQVELPAGGNPVEIEMAFGANGGPNIDTLIVEPVVPVPVPLPGPVNLAGRPSRATTGIPVGTPMAAAPAGFRPVAGQTYRNMMFAGQFFPVLGGGTTTFVNCLFDGKGNTRSIRTDRCQGTVVFDHCEITNSNDEAIYGPFWQAIGCYVHGHNADGFKALHDCVLQNCYITDLGRGVNVHADGLQLLGNGNVKVTGNFFDQGHDVHCNRNLMASLNGLRNIQWNNNWHSGSGAFAIQLFDSTEPNTIEFRNNVFARFPGNPRMYIPRHVQPNVTWVNNKFEDGTPV